MRLNWLVGWHNLTHYAFCLVRQVFLSDYGRVTGVLGVLGRFLVGRRWEKCWSTGHGGNADGPRESGPTDSFSVFATVEIKVRQVKMVS